MPAPKKVLRRLLALLAPESCAFCADVTEGEACCSRCLGLLPRNTRCCASCANPLSTQLPLIESEPFLCARCQQEPPIFVETCAPLLYEFPVDTAIKSLKFRGQLFYLPVFADIMTEAVRQRPMQVDALLPVPLHFTRRIRRGFNQAEELGKLVAQKLDLPLVRTSRRVRRTATQSDLHKSERAKNVESAFSVSSLRGCRRPLIVDDVMTTGETCNAFAKALIDAGADEVRVLVIARARPPD